MLLLHIDTLSALRKVFKICCRMGLSLLTCETTRWAFSFLKKSFCIFCRMRQPPVFENESLAFCRRLPKFCCRMRQPQVYENKPLAFSRRIPIFAAKCALAPSMWDNWMCLISPSLSFDATSKTFQDNKRSCFAKIGSFIIRSPPTCASCILQ